MAPVPSPATTTDAVVLVLVVEELLVLQIQTRLAVGEQLTPVGHAPLVVHQELRGKQGSRVRDHRVRFGGHVGGHRVTSGVTGSGKVATPLKKK